MDNRGAELRQRTAGHEPLRRLRVRAHNDVLHRHHRQCNGLLRGPEGAQVPAARLLYRHLHPVRDDPDRRHPGLRVPREGRVHDEAGDARHNSAVRPAEDHHQCVGQCADEAALLRSGVLQGLEGTCAALVLYGDLRGAEETVRGISDVGQYVQ